ncbi:MAG: PilZ domain-containing protein [Planctomycetota bacterium]
MSLHQQIPTPPNPPIQSAIQEMQGAAQSTASRRSKNRVAINSQAVIFPANAIDRDGTEIKGLCRDVSTSGCRVIMKKPLMVGSVYFMELIDSQTAIDPMFVRCIRCHLLREDTFECGLSFLSPLNFENEDALSDSLLNLDLD